MQISASSSVDYAAQAQRIQQVSKARETQSQSPLPVGYDGPDAEGDGDADDAGTVTATRGNLVNIVA
jgi:hypothetical protein